MRKWLGAGEDWDARLHRGNRNAFDVVRLALASMVVLEHSYYLIQISSANDPLSLLSRGQTNFGQFAVFMFFALSGFLVTQSFVTSSGVANFLAKRVARIVPGFLIASAFGVLIVGPLTTGSVSAYFAGQNWRAIVVSAVALKQVSVAGALVGNPLDLVHGTLWTIQYEFDCYLLLAVFGALGLLKPHTRLAFFAALAAAFAASMAFRLPVINAGLVALLISSPHQWPDLFPFFFLGSAFFLFRAHIPKSAAIFTACLVVIALTFAFGGAYWALLFCGTYATLYVALSFKGEVRLAGRRVDLSYGVYLYGWPVQQLIIYYLGTDIGPLPLFALSIIASYPVAWASWTFVERPALATVRHHALRQLEGAPA